MSDCGAELQLLGMFEPSFEIIAMHGNPMVIDGDGMLRSIVGPEVVPFTLPLEELASDTMAADVALSYQTLAS